MKIIQMSPSGEVKVDDKDYPHLKRLRWYNDGKGYAVSRSYSESGKLEQVKMHRLIAKCPNNLVVDHINRDPSDNRRENLRCVTRRQNTLNRRLNSNNKSGYKGVSWNKGYSRWAV